MAGARSDDMMPDDVNETHDDAPDSGPHWRGVLELPIADLDYDDLSEDLIPPPPPAAAPDDIPAEPTDGLPG
jgi:hypothetical protein